MKTRIISAMAGAAALLLAVPAVAQDDTDVVIIEEEERYQGERTDQERAEQRASAEEERDTALTVRGGANNFTGTAGDILGVGPALGVQLENNRDGPIRIEYGYEGSRNPLVAGDGAMWRHNVGAMAKVGPEIGNAKPFVGGGVGASYLNATDEADNVLADQDVLAEFPVAAGLEYDFGAVTAGARATYRFMALEDYVPDGGRLFGVSATIGGQF